MNKIKKILLITILLLPITVFAKEKDGISVTIAYIWELFSTLHVSIFTLKPLSQYLARDGSITPKDSFWKLFFARIVLLLIITPIFPHIFLVDFFSMFVIPILGTKYKKAPLPAKIAALSTNNSVVVGESPQKTCPKCSYTMSAANVRCPKCGTKLENTQIELVPEKKYICEDCKYESLKEIKYCPKCGSSKINIVDTNQATEMLDPKSGKAFNRADYEKYMFTYDEDTAIQEIIKEELQKNPDIKNKTLTTMDRKKFLMTLIYSIIILIISTIYAAYHTNLFFIIFLFIVLTIVFFKITSGYDIKKYLIKEIKNRPDEKMNYVITSTLSSYGTNKTIGIFLRLIILLITIITPLLLFKTPHLIYEKVAGGYNVRYYTLGIFKQDKIVEIPSTYKGQNVIGIRGDTFERSSSIEKIILPETITEIRAGAFKKCTNLKEINIPSKVTTISANTFEGCTSLENIELPDSIEEIRGEAFLNCTNLKEVKLPPNITEIHGSTFENCTSLTQIDIPEGVTRIGGSAFRECHNLNHVTIPKSVIEIASSAFRNTSLNDVCISKKASVNERAFKGIYPYPKIAYYENDCIYQEPTYNYNNYTYEYNNSEGVNTYE